MIALISLNSVFFKPPYLFKPEDHHTGGIFEAFQVIHRINASEWKRLQKFYAHSVEGKPVSQWHRLEEHLKGTVELAAAISH